MAEVQRLAKADPSVTIMVGQGKREKAVKGKKEGTGAFLFDIAMSNQWYFDQMLEIGVAQAPQAHAVYCSIRTPIRNPQGCMLSTRQNQVTRWYLTFNGAGA